MGCSAGKETLGMPFVAGMQKNGGAYKKVSVLIEIPDEIRFKLFALLQTEVRF